MPAHAQAFAAVDAAVHQQVLPHEGAGAHAERAVADHVPRCAQVAAAVQRFLHLHAPVGAQVAAAVQPPIAVDVRAGADVLARHDGAASADAAPRMEGAADVDHAVHLDAAAHLHGAREHQGLGLQAVQVQHCVRGAELAQQPQRVVHAAGGHQLVQRLLVAHTVLDMAHEPAKAVGAGALGPEKLLGEFHATLQSLQGARAVLLRGPGVTRRTKGPRERAWEGVVHRCAGRVPGDGGSARWKEEGCFIAGRRNVRPAGMARAHAPRRPRGCAQGCGGWVCSGTWARMLAVRSPRDNLVARRRAVFGAPPCVLRGGCACAPAAGRG